MIDHSKNSPNHSARQTLHERLESRFPSSEEGVQGGDQSDLVSALARAAAEVAGAENIAKPTARGKPAGQIRGRSRPRHGGIGTGGGGGGRRRVILRRLIRVLVRTPDDGTGLVEGTPFKKAGVAELMRLLEARRAKADGKPARAIEVVHRFLTNGEGPDMATIHGARLDQLLLLNRMMQRMRQSRRGAG